MLGIFRRSLLKYRGSIRSLQPSVRETGTLLWRSDFGAIFSRGLEPVTAVTSFESFTSSLEMSQAKISAFFLKKGESTTSAFDTSSGSEEAGSPVKARAKKKSRIISSDRYVFILDYVLTS